MTNTINKIRDYFRGKEKLLSYSGAILLAGSIILTSLGFYQYIKTNSNRAEHQAGYPKVVRGKIPKPPMSDEEAIKKASKLDEMMEEIEDLR